MLLEVSQGCTHVERGEARQPGTHRQQGQLALGQLQLVQGVLRHQRLQSFQAGCIQRAVSNHQLAQVPARRVAGGVC